MFGRENLENHVSEKVFLKGKIKENVDENDFEGDAVMEMLIK